MKRFTSVSATALAAALVLAGCGADTASNTAATPAPTTAATASAPADHNSADTRFVQSMIPHHEQAVQMSEIMLAKQDLDPQIKQLADDIKAAQGPEIKTMEGWLQGWAEAGTSGGHHQMDAGRATEGMMGAEDLDRLKAARGDDAARLFLTQMTAHHEGAIQMAKEEVANGSNPEVIALAEKVIKDQQAEIDKMKDLLTGR
ncbi:DUF305 domain-containing protein [Arthrobacter sp. E918]|uniref:DUF305 domain-containing protein n=2 Tax=Arthrobacter mobilis TaxID=2724944 RepID=A0A7X6HGM1_9MICC|nr:DUF305 domain-containing protein [Arthrobacter mobilis]